MKKKNISPSAFFNYHSILGIGLCSIGLLLGFICLALFPGAPVLEGRPVPRPHVRGLTAPPPQPTGPRPRLIPKARKGRAANPRPALSRTPPSIARAAVSNTFVVNNLGDTHNVGPGCADAGGNCTLRAAVEAANADAPNIDAIVLPAGLITLSLGELPVSNSMLISGGGVTSVIDANSTSTIFHVTDDAALELTNAVLRNAVSSNINGYGGAIYIENGTLTASGVTLTGNSATDGGAIYVEDQGSLWLSHSTLTRNSAQDGGAVYAYGPSNFANNLFGGPNASDGNHASSEGGGLYTDAATLIENTDFTNNNADSDGGGLYIDAPTIINGGTFALNGAGVNGPPPDVAPLAPNGKGASGYGGAIYQDSYTSTITGTTFSRTEP